MPAHPGRAEQAAELAPAILPRDYVSSDDTSLIAGCLRGDGRAWDVLVERYSPLVYSLPRRMGLSAADTEDVLQNVFTIVFRRLDSLKNHKCLAAWLITITRREYMRYSQRAPDHAELEDEIVDGGNRLGDRVEERERRLLVHQALNQLDTTSRALLVALFLEHPTPSYSEIARRLGMAVGSIGPARARSLKKLEAQLAELDPDWVCLSGPDE